MIKSMTGYGRGEASGEGLTVTVELRAVNNRYLDCAIKMPRSYLFAEEALKERIQSKVGRGKVDVFVNVSHIAGDDMTVTVNQPLAKAYVDALEQLIHMGGGWTKDSYYPTDLARFPDVLTVEKKEEEPEAVKALLLQAMDEALADFNVMREREGGRLAKDVLDRT